MVFANLFFLYIFLPVNLILYYATRSYAVRNFVLVAMSFLFYAWGEPVWVLLLLASGFMVWLCSLLVERFAGTRRGKAALILAVTISLSLLGIFKYSGFLIENINAVPAGSAVLAAHRHQFLHLPDDLLYRGCLSR